MVDEQEPGAAPAVERAVGQTAQTPRQALLKEIGHKLIEAREARDEPLAKVVRKLKLRQVHLEALEQGNWDSLPDDVYALGFLRQYSNYLSLDLSEDIERIKNDQYTLTRPLTFPDPPVAPSRRWSWIAAIAFIALFIAFNIFDLEFSLSPKPAEQAEQMSAPEPSAAPPATESMPAEIAPPADEESADASAVSEAVSKPAAEPEPAAVAEPETPVEVPAPEPSTIPAEEPVKETSAVPAVVHSFRFEAIADAVWMQVFLPDESGNKGMLRKEVLLQSGGSFTINEAVDSLWITCGNPVALQISVDGQVVSEAGSLGSVGKVLRDYHFRINP